MPRFALLPSAAAIRPQASRELTGSESASSSSGGGHRFSSAAAVSLNWVTGGSSGFRLRPSPSRGRYSRVSGQSLKPLNIEDCHGMLFDIGDSLFA